MDDFKTIDIRADLNLPKGKRDGDSPKTGFQSSADDHRENGVDWHDLLLGRRFDPKIDSENFNELLNGRSKFWCKVEGSSIPEANILPGDVLFYDRKLEPKDGSVIFLTLEDQFTVRIFESVGNRIFLKAPNSKYRTIEVLPGLNYKIEGVVTWILYQAQRRV